MACAVTTSKHALTDYGRIARWHEGVPFTSQSGLATSNGGTIRAAISSHLAAELAALYSEEEASNVVL